MRLPASVGILANLPTPEGAEVAKRHLETGDSEPIDDVSQREKSFTHPLLGQFLAAIGSVPL